MRTAATTLNGARAEALMAREGLDALIAASAENVNYASGFHSPTPYTFNDAQNFALVPRKTSDSALVMPRDELTWVGVDPVAVEDIRVYGYTTLIWDERATYGNAEDDVMSLMISRPQYKSPVEGLVAGVEDRGLGRARLGIDQRGMREGSLETLRRLLPNAELVPASDHWVWIRAVKTPLEVERIRRAAEINEAGEWVAMAATQVGVTELELYTAYQTAAIAMGGYPRYWGAGVGSGASLFCPPDPTYRARAGDVVRIDTVTTCAGYWADTGRTVALNPVSDKTKTYHAALVEGMRAGLEMVRPGARPSKIFETVVETVKRAGIPHWFRFHVGHGIGLEFYEIPRIRPLAEGQREADEVVLEEGMVFNLETPYYELGYGGLQIEDTLVVTATGYEYLTHHSRDLLVK